MKFKLDQETKKIILLKVMDYIAIIGAVAGVVVLGYFLMTGVLPNWFAGLQEVFKDAITAFNKAQSEGSPYSPD